MNHPFGGTPMAMETPYMKLYEIHQLYHVLAFMNCSWDTGSRHGYTWKKSVKAMMAEVGLSENVGTTPYHVRFFFMAIVVCVSHLHRMGYMLFSYPWLFWKDDDKNLRYQGCTSKYLRVGCCVIPMGISPWERTGPILFKALARMKQQQAVIRAGRLSSGGHL